MGGREGKGGEKRGRKRGMEGKGKEGEGRGRWPSPFLKS